MAGSSLVTVRPALIEDGEWIVSLIPRLHAFGPPPYRNIEKMNAAEAAATLAAVASESPERAVLVATGAAGDRLGVVHLETAVDFFTRERHGHISVVAVAPDAENRGVGRALLQAAEEWTRGRGYRFLTLNVFEHNERARHVYERAGYGIDTIKYLKMV